MEVHWHIVRPEDGEGLDLEGLWGRAVPLTLGGEAAHALSPADTLLHLGLHLYHHRFEMCVSALCDVAAVTRRQAQELDWTQLSEALPAGLHRKVTYLALRLARDWLAAPVPQAALAALYPGDPGEGPALLQAQILSPEASLSLKMRPLTQLWGRQTARQKARAVWGALFPAPAELALHYPPAAPGVLGVYRHYPHYLQRALRRYGRTLWRLLRGDPRLRQEAARLEALDQWLRAP